MSFYLKSLKNIKIFYFYLIQDALKNEANKTLLFQFTLGEPLFFKEEIAGLYVPSVTEPYGETDEKFYVRLREKCTGQLSN